MSSYYNRGKRVQPSSSTDWLYNSVDKANPILKLSNGQLTSSLGTSLMSLANFKSVGSYNWSTSDSLPNRPVVIIPGAGDRLNNVLEPMQLIKNERLQIADENRHHQPDYPLEALFRAVQICSPQFDFSAVQFVTDRNNLRKMLNYVEGKSLDESFRIDFQRVGNMVVLMRNDERVSMPCNDYGKDFERNYTESLLNQGSYRRIVSYKFGDFNMLVRFEVDCVIKEQQPVNSSAASSSDDPVDGIISGMNRGLNVSLGRVNKFESDQPDLSLHYIQHGEFDETERLVELTTKSAPKHVGMQFPENKWNQLFFSRTDTLVIGWHVRGQLQKIEKLSFDQVTQRSKRSTADTEKSLAKLHDLLDRIRKLAAKEPQNGIESPVYSIVFDHTGPNQEITIYKCEGHNGALPDTCRQSILNTQ